MPSGEQLPRIRRIWTAKIWAGGLIGKNLSIRGAKICLEFNNSRVWTGLVDVKFMAQIVEPSTILSDSSIHAKTSGALSR